MTIMKTQIVWLTAEEAQKILDLKAVSTAATTYGIRTKKIRVGGVGRPRNHFHRDDVHAAAQIRGTLPNPDTEGWVDAKTAATLVGVPGRTVSQWAKDQQVEWVWASNGKARIRLFEPESVVARAEKYVSNAQERKFTEELLEEYDFFRSLPMDHTEALTLIARAYSLDFESVRKRLSYHRPQGEVAA